MKAKERLTAENGERGNENVAQILIAERLYPDKEKREAFMAFATNGEARTFRRIMDEQPELKERIDSGDEGVIDEVLALMEEATE